MLPYLALAAVCFFWGTTYLGIRIALESIPPTVLIAARFLLSGGALLVWAFAAGQTFPKGRDLWKTAAIGVLILGVANGALTFAETRIASGLAALIITTAPFWMTGAEALIPGGERLRRRTVGGMLVGSAGVLLLIGPDAFGANVNLNSVWGFLILQVGNAAWAFGSIFQKRMASAINPVVNGAIQQTAAGAVYLLISLVLQPGPVEVTSRGIWAVVYLATFGSIVSYSAYLYVLEKLPVSIVSTYTYIKSGGGGDARMVVLSGAVWVARSERDDRDLSRRVAGEARRALVALVENLRPERAADTGGDGEGRKGGDQDHEDHRAHQLLHGRDFQIRLRRGRLNDVVAQHLRVSLGADERYGHRHDHHHDQKAEDSGDPAQTRAARDAQTLPGAAVVKPNGEVAGTGCER
jgi:drug/metabolite transporter (DMT)-like permease